MKRLIIASLILAASTHGMAGGRSRSSSPAPTASVAPSPSLKPGVYVRVGKITGATAAEEKLVRAAVELANAKLAGPCMKQWVLAARYTEVDGMTQAQVWEKIISTPTLVDVDIYTGNWKANHVYKTMGYETDPFDGIVHMNRHFVKTAVDMADLLLHEDRGHSIGFKHYGVKSTSEPYGMNYAFEGCSQTRQMMQAMGGKAYKPPGVRIEVRKLHPREKRSKVRY